MADGGGLFVLVKPNGSKIWQQKYRHFGKERLLSHGRPRDAGNPIFRNST
ncbi:Arm DNA-binding domain-containing protein [Yoonia sp.]